MRWKPQFLNQEYYTNTTQIKVWIKNKKNPRLPQHHKVGNFETALTNIIRHTKFHNNLGKFQSELKENIEKVKRNLPNTFIKLETNAN